MHNCKIVTNPLFYQSQNGYENCVKTPPKKKGGSLCYFIFIYYSTLYFIFPQLFMPFNTISYWIMQLRILCLLSTLCIKNTNDNKNIKKTGHPSDHSHAWGCLTSEIEWEAAGTT